MLKLILLSLLWPEIQLTTTYNRKITEFSKPFMFWHFTLLQTVNLLLRPPLPQQAPLSNTLRHPFWSKKFISPSPSFLSPAPRPLVWNT